MPGCALVGITFVLSVGLHESVMRIYMPWMLIMEVVAILLVLFGGVLLMKQARGAAGGADLLGELKRKLVSGEIGEEEYSRKKALITA